MLQGSAAKLTTLVILALLVAVVPGAVRLFERDSSQRVETDADPSPDGTAEGDDLGDEAAAEALPLVSDTDTLFDLAPGGDDQPRLLDLTDGTTSEPGDTDDAAKVGDEVGDGVDPEATDETQDQPAADGDGTGSAGVAESAPTDDGAGAEAGDGTTSTTVPSSTTTAPPTTAPPASTTTVRPAPPGTAPGTGLRTLYVDPNRGSYSNPGTEDRPFRRPVEALTKAQPGDTIYLRAGSYDTSVHSGFNITRSGTPDRWIRIAPYPGERVELIAGGEYGSGFEFLGASYVELTGFVIRGRNDSLHGSGVFVKDGAHDIRIVGNEISNFGGAGISVIGSSRVTIEGNRIHDNAMRSHYQGSGITLFKMVGPTNSGHTNVVRGNYIYNNRTEVPHRDDGRITDGNCIIMDRNDESGYRGWTLIENNVCAENGGRGVHSYRSSYIEARNNTLYHNVATAAIDSGRGEMTAGHGRDIYFYNNLVINRSGVAAYIDTNNTNSRFENNYVASGPPPGSGNQVLSGGAIFSSTTRGGSVTQFRPVGGAGLAGTADGSKQAPNDYLGNRRPGTGAVGAFEP